MSDSKGDYGLKLTLDDGTEYALEVMHLPDRKKPMLVFSSTESKQSFAIAYFRNEECAETFNKFLHVLRTGIHNSLRKATRNDNDAGNEVKE